MNEAEWHEIYKKRMMERTAGDEAFGQMVLETAIEGGDIDYENNPIDAADEELTYWQE